ncbi:TPA: 30S ribosomal protein S6 [candidate division CPR2 bacterium]|uniref:Small ribosomal subunit protein bS6 n=1 Tax=candidate division CPR2 bacterium GW2011_GWC1_41_48 TaxID=1618344 RepID=A0A0G0Z8F8_UNCC2|nr:MAG: 30S ribosomal protein S6 [candidate division CPR2 bacterium GW2011_GWC2_39_35]KKR28537.1 MAG: 30S ribosomal protein S6 [candidate division CPR2 bacterium GW2011_GWD2_39_7]KKS09333.1 MAG: 30S ribosomal protein S6 [candidate division CPR2 bacterium GW2011_GWC1_41_48]OGB72809.1 MAG: 30S ribosomal protein S6 [candidate division CPR2 bacterium GWD2_39_7]HBG82089.1 30S ribosomal protein S6 [candidate division CPR2 bacterium]
MQRYELAYIIHPDLENTLDKVTDRVNKFVNSHGKVIMEDIWGKRKLAYSIRKQNYGLYVILNMDLEPSAVSELEKLLRRTEEILRFMILSYEKEGVSVSGVASKVASEKVAKKTKEAEVAKEETAAEEVEAKKVSKETVKKEKKPEEASKAEETKKKAKAVKAEEGEPSEEERMSELDKKLKQILGDEEK